MNLVNSPSSSGLRMKQLPFSEYTFRTNSGSSEPAATTTGMCINDGVDLSIFKTFNPEIRGSDKSKKMRSGIPTSRYLPCYVPVLSLLPYQWTWLFWTHAVPRALTPIFSFTFCSHFSARKRPIGRNVACPVFVILCKTANTSLSKFFFIFFFTYEIIQLITAG